MPPITDHVFRGCNTGGNHDSRTGTSGGPAITPGMCWYLTSCNRPESEHVSADEYRRIRART